MVYRKQIDKIYKKIEAIAQNGPDYYLDFNDYIDEIIDSGLYSVFEDVMYFKYNISTKKYLSISDLKKGIFKEIRSKTISRSQKNLSNLYKSLKVYSNGFHYYDSETNKFLGDIKEVERNVYEPNTSVDDREFNRPLPKLEITVGLSSSFYSAISDYGSVVDRDVKYVTYSQVIYDYSIYECIKSYTWRSPDVITPTYSEYWILSNVPTYSIFEIKDTDKNLLEKYEEAINLLKSLN